MAGWFVAIFVFIAVGAPQRFELDQCAGRRRWHGRRHHWRFDNFFLLAGRMAYVPQTMLVEGRVASNQSQHFFSQRECASSDGHGALYFICDISALMLLMFRWAGMDLNGVDLSPFGATWPTWYAIGYQVILQCSHITLAPIWMLGLSLYVDERVRHEGYDLELMAARQLPEMPTMPGVVSPFSPALVTGRAPTFVPPPLVPIQSQNVLGLS